MGASGECTGQEHERCAEPWCDCGCHHELIEAHYDGKHAVAVDRCHVCAREAREEPLLVGKRARLREIMLDCMFCDPDRLHEIGDADLDKWIASHEGP